jgi:hypothetical protein
MPDRDFLATKQSVLASNNFKARKMALIKLCGLKPHDGRLHVLDSRASDSIVCPQIMAMPSLISLSLPCCTKLVLVKKVKVATVQVPHPGAVLGP